MPDEEAFFLYVGDPPFFGRGRESQHADVLVVVTPLLDRLRGERALPEIRTVRRRNGKLDLDPGPSGNPGRRCHEVLHRLLSLDPGAAAAGPAGPYAQDHLDAGPLAFRKGVLEYVQPFGAHEVDIAAGHPDIHLQEHHIADTLVTHGLQVLGDPLLGEVPVHEIPVHPGACVRRGRFEIPGKDGRSGRVGGIPRA